MTITTIIILAGSAVHHMILTEQHIKCQLQYRNNAVGKLILVILRITILSERGRELSELK